MSIQALQSRQLVSDPITYTQTTVAALNIPAKTLVRDVRAVVTTLFAGTTPTIDVGDGDDADGWVDKDDVTETTAGSYVGTVAAGASYAAAGKYYATADTIDVVIGGTSLTAGVVVIVADIVELKDIV